MVSERYRRMTAVFAYEHLLYMIEEAPLQISEECE